MHRPKSAQQIENLNSAQLIHSWNNEVLRLVIMLARSVIIDIKWWERWETSSWVLPFICQQFIHVIDFYTSFGWSYFNRTRLCQNQ